jgi:hypothetical protein
MGYDIPLHHRLAPLGAPSLLSSFLDPPLVGLGKDRPSPRAERGSKLMGLLLRILYGLCIQKDRVGLD